MVRFSTRETLLVVAFLCMVLALTSCFQSTTNWNRLVPWNYVSKFDVGEHTAFETWVKSLVPSILWATLIFAGVNGAWKQFRKIYSVEKVNEKTTQ